MSEIKSRVVTACQQALACAVAVAVVAPAAGVATLEIVAPTEHGGTATPQAAGSVAQAELGLVAAEPVAPDVTEVPLTKPDAASEDTTTGEAQPLDEEQLAGDAAAEDEQWAAEAGEGELAGAVSTPQELAGYATVGVTWSGDEQLDEDDIRVSARTLRDGTWSSWQELHYDAEHGPTPGTAEAEAAAGEQALEQADPQADPQTDPQADPQAGDGLRGGTDPVVVGDADDVQVRAVTTTGELPADMDLVIVDPGETSLVTEQAAIDTAAPGLATTGAPATAATPTSAGSSDTGDAGDTAAPVAGLTPVAAKLTPKPKIFSRAQWGANERLRDKSSLSYGEVHAGFVHHTVNANSYSRAQVPAIIRGIYAYHTQSRGWSDVGYNFLVDRFGRIWEGRYGGVARPVVGAHTLNFNENSFALSAIGNFDTARPAAAVIDAYGRLFAWKLSLHGVRADARKQRVGSRTLPAVNGHRDVGQTACPGRYLYARLGAIRTKAAGYQRLGAGRGKDMNVSGSRWPDLVVRDRRTKQVSVVQTDGQVGFRAGRAARTGWKGMDIVTAVRDVTGDGRPDLMARSRATKVTGVYPGDGKGGFGRAVRTSKRFASLNRLSGAGDLNRDGRADLVGRHAGTGRLLFYPGRSTGQFGPARVLANGWSAYDALTGAGDLTGDGRPDLVARSGQTLWLVPVGKGPSIGKRRALPGKWAGFDRIAGLGDVTNDGRADLLARSRKSGQTYVYPGNNRGGLGQRLGGFTRFAGVGMLSAAGNVDGRPGSDLVGRTRAGTLVVYSNSGGRGLAGRVPTGRAISGVNALLSVGDWNRDGRNDVMARRASDGAMLLYRGAAGGRLTAPVVAGRGWGGLHLLTAVGDVTGDGAPDVMAQPRGGALRIYPGNGRTGFGASWRARSNLAGNKHVGAGLWNGDGAPDTLVRLRDGSLNLQVGNGPGGVSSATRVAGGTGRYDWLIGAGDVDGDGDADLVARQKADGGLWLLPGRGTGLGPRRWIAGGFDRYDLVG